MKYIIIIENSKADKEGIIDGFDKIISQVKKGDFVVIHYSGHGQQISDNNNDEIDGFDEALIPYGAPALFKPGYKGEKHLRIRMQQTALGIRDAVARQQPANVRQHIRPDAQRQ